MADRQHNLRIRKLALRNYKSIEQCSVALAPLTALVGRNGAGKSNVIDALRFINDALSNTLEFAIRERGGVDRVRRKSLGAKPRHFSIAVTVGLDGGVADYRFTIVPVVGRSFRIGRESCVVRGPDGQESSRYRTEDGRVKDWSLEGPPPPTSDDRLLLVAASGYPAFREVFDVLTRMTFHNLNPEVMKYPQRPEPGERLAHDGHNLASVVKRLQEDAPANLQRVVDYLKAIGVHVDRVEHKHAGALETLQVAQVHTIESGTRNALFDAISLSDGTIRALGILVSLVSGQGDLAGPTLIGIEEPETALHPAATSALVDALLEGSDSTQVMMTCHSPDMLEHPEIKPEMIRVVMIEDDKTVVGPLSPARARLMNDYLTSGGELLRLDQLTPDPEDLARQRLAIGNLFGTNA